MEELNRISVEDFRNRPKMPVMIVLDNIRSQHNTGSVFRTADAFRAEGIYLCGITATPPNREIHKTALGATESVNWSYFPSTIGAVHELKRKGYKIIAIEQTDKSIPLKEFISVYSQPAALIFGNEINGVSDEVLSICDISLEIPQAGTKHSLNISVAAGIVLWHFFNMEKNI